MVSCCWMILVVARMLVTHLIEMRGTGGGKKYSLLHLCGGDALFCNPDDDVSKLEEYEDCVQIVSALVSD